MLNSLIKPDFVGQNEKLQKSFDKTQALIEALNQRELPEDTQAAVQAEIEGLNAGITEVKAYTKSLSKAYNNMVKRVQKDVGLSPKGYHRSQWMVLGMTIFGLPLGMAFGMMLDNLGLMGLGLPIGMGIGLAIGSGLDEKAAKEGKQLSV
ncbi:MAG: hypothetical protein AAF927_16725 [Bacteroidota bacterium]